MEIMRITFDRKDNTLDGREYLILIILLMIIKQEYMMDVAILE